MASGTAEARAPIQPDWACDWRCPEHSERPAELFCRRCGRCVCALCPVLGTHRGHPVGLAEEEAVRVQVGSHEGVHRRSGRVEIEYRSNRRGSASPGLTAKSR